MVKIEATVQPYTLDAIKDALDNLGIGGITISHVMDHSARAGIVSHYRGAPYRVDAPKVKLEMLVSSFRAEEVIDVLSRAARAGSASDDGIVLAWEVADAMRIRAGERVQFTLTED